MAKALIVYHSQTGNTRKLAMAVKDGIKAVGVDVILKKASEATLKDLLTCRGYCFGTPDYFSYMAGALKDFFDRTCYPSEGKITGRPCVYLSAMAAERYLAAMASRRRSARN
jgi:multimeric flavodoxin WrbA